MKTRKEEYGYGRSVRQPGICEDRKVERRREKGDRWACTHVNFLKDNFYIHVQYNEIQQQRLQKRQNEKQNNKIPGEGDILVADEADLLPVKGKW